MGHRPPTEVLKCVGAVTPEGGNACLTQELSIELTSLRASR